MDRHANISPPPNALCEIQSAIHSGNPPSYSWLARIRINTKCLLLFPIVCSCLHMMSFKTHLNPKFSMVIPHVQPQKWLLYEPSLSLFMTHNIYIYYTLIYTYI
jgi:hypothetical protein